MCLEEFVLPVTPIEAPVSFNPKILSVRNNGAIRFLIVSRARGQVDWVIPSWSVASQVVNEVQNTAIASVKLEDLAGTDFYTYPKDLLPCTEVTVLLKTSLRT